MRLHPPPADRRLAPAHPHAALLDALALAQATLAAHDSALAQSLAELGEIDLPAGAPTAQDRSQLLAAAPLYFASMLETAGVLAAAEQIAALFASGAITQPLGPGAQSLNAFWRGRRERLSGAERDAIFKRVFEPPYFARLMRALCAAIVAQADGGDMREDVALASSAQALGELLAQRTDAMATLAAREIVDNLNAALGFLRERMLQSAFGVQSLWALVGAAHPGIGIGGAQSLADQGRAGQQVLLWLAAQQATGATRLDPARADDLALMSAAQRWLLAAHALERTPAPALQRAA
ncbi:hypothetical protein [Xanthomonas hortorum]|uniref:hypothetical protein n=1 Tax=Xanthomonas hortorum TaxID=56454 RepID=UPI001E636362|nr:hypothetical protein [Xanthomonas hortorum]MCC8552483.1 hypothetical protein [Xanthomonas hortorum pv. gardneri]MCE4364992.1 hypothetical protein [Xanthomonas hortorum]